jgi:putative phosphoribosyl transferase
MRPRAKESTITGMEEAHGRAGVQEVEIEARSGPGTVSLPGDLAIPPSASGLVLFAHGSGSTRRSPRNRRVAERLQREGLATLLFDLLTPDESADRSLVFDIPLLASRLMAATRWATANPGVGSLPFGYFGASTGAGAALWGAAEPENAVAAVVSRGGRPDLAGPRLGDVRAPTLLMVGSLDGEVLDLNRQAQAQLRCPSELVVVPGASHLFEEAGTLEQVADHAAVWFGRHLPGRSG